MKKLIERLEKASGPDRALDASIAVALDLREDWLKGDDRPLVASADEAGCPSSRRGHVSAGKYGPGFEAPMYTASIDAALTLLHCLHMIEDGRYFDDFYIRKKLGFEPVERWRAVPVNG